MRIPLSPHDTVPLAILRFVLELAALFAIGASFGVLNFLVSVVALSLFNAKGDKRFQGIRVSGPIRLTIEVVIALLGVYGIGLIWGVLWMGLFGAVWALYIIVARQRLLWLARGAREEER